MRHILFFVFMSWATISLAQTTDLTTLPAYDCSIKKVMAILERKTVISSPGNDKGLEAILTDYCSTFGSNCIIKKEAELTANDYAKDILVVGVLGEFKNWSKLGLPIGQVKDGFVVNNKVFKDKSDGFAFVDSSRIVISGNSLKAVKDAQLALTGGYDILIVEGGKITYFGNRKNSLHFNWYNLQNLKTTNYNKKNSELFSAIYVSKQFNDTINYPKLYANLKLYAQQFLNIYKLKLPVKKVSWFLHSNMTEYGMMSGMFGLTCPGNNSAGFSIRGEIHTNGFNPTLVKHEYSHFLFDNTIPQDNSCAFFVEGAVEYVTDLIINNRDFYGQYSGVNYSVCGIFVKYIIDEFGAEAFKKYCLTANKKRTTREVFNVDFEELIDGYKKWLDKY